MAQIAVGAVDTETTLLARLNCFAVLWAMSSIFQLFALGSVIESLAAATPQGIVEIALFFSAAAVIWRPRLQTLLVMASLQIADAVILLPHLPNNRLVTCFVNLTLLLAFISCPKGGSGSRASRVFSDFSKTIRGVVLLFYFFAVFAKLNTGFLSPTTSCASVFYSRMAAWFPLAPLRPWAVESVIYVTIACEFLIPVFLFFRPTRNFGIALGIIFHSLLSIDYFQHTMDFGSLIFALLFLFTPANFLETLQNKFFASFTADTLSALISWLRFAIMALFAVVLIMGLIPGERGERGFFLGKHLLWYSYAITVAIVFLAALYKSSRYFIPLQSPFKLSSAVMATPLVLVFVNGCGPYVGLKSRSSFDMYSNLRMEEPQPNHLIVPNSLDIFGIQNDRVTILESRDPWLADAKRRGFEITYFEFVQHVYETPGIQVEYSRNGERYAVHSDEERLALKLPPALARKFLWFRSIDREALVRCDW